MLIAILRHAVLRRPLRHAVISDNSGAVLRRQYPLVQSSRWLQSQAYPGNIVPLRKQLKIEAKAKKSDRNGDSVVDAGDLRGTAVSQEWELTVGLEIHAQLNTERKLFSGNTYLALKSSKRLMTIQTHLHRPMISPTRKWLHSTSHYQAVNR